VVNGKKAEKDKARAVQKVLKMRIRATLHCMAESEIRSMIPADKLREIKAKCAKPVFRAYVVGHEGEARGNLVGVGNIVKKWFSDMVRKLNDKISVGLQLFHGHAETNDTEGRVPIGEVVAKKIMTIKDRLSSVMIGWIFPDYCNLPLDVASIEADVDLEGSIKGGNLFVSDVNDITGIALGNSEIETPGFPGATLLGQLQAFAENNSTLKYGVESPAFRLGYRINNTSQPKPFRLVEEKNVRSNYD